MSLELKTPDTAEVQPNNVATYEAPQIETVLSAEELEREVAYAGITAISPSPSPGVGVGGGSLGGGEIYNHQYL